VRSDFFLMAHRSASAKSSVVRDIALAADIAALKRNEEGVSASGNWLYWFFCSLTACAFSSSAFCQLALGLYSFIDLATTSVFLPRSF
jgi:hypothetical protein